MAFAPRRSMVRLLAAAAVLASAATSTAVLAQGSLPQPADHGHRALQRRR
jgi:hypothetical protein